MYWNMIYKDSGMSDLPIPRLFPFCGLHLTQKGKSLGIDKSDIPESLYGNPSAYPGMFPWLFPYGKGGIGHESHRFIIADKTRKRSLLLYHDKRFQMDTYFPMISFNHEQLKGPYKGSRIVVKRSKFADVSRRLLQMDPKVAADIADRLVAEENVKPETEAASNRCAISMVSVHPASVPSKKHMRNEICSMTVFMGAPTWFITLSRSDITHPIALYHAQTDSTFKPDLRASDERNLLMSRNPVAAARFFYFMVQLFLKEVLCWQDENGGLFGHTEAYYSTVEPKEDLPCISRPQQWMKTVIDSEDSMSEFLDKEPDYGSDSTGLREQSDSESDWASDDEDASRSGERTNAGQTVTRSFPIMSYLKHIPSTTITYSKLSRVIPNFMGGCVPRADKGHRDYYCATVMTLFKPWRSPADLKDTESSWDQIFTEHTFAPRELELTSVKLHVCLWHLTSFGDVFQHLCLRRLSLVLRAASWGIFVLHALSYIFGQWSY
jgi:hypothetical protein